MFLLTLFIAMGTTLFSCKNESGDKVTIDKIEIVNDSLNHIDNIKNSGPLNTSQHAYDSLKKCNDSIKNIDIINPKDSIPLSNFTVGVTAIELEGKVVTDDYFIPRRVHKMAIYPNSKTGKNKKEAIHNFAKAIQKDIHAYLDTSFPEEAKKENLKQVKAMLEFVVTKDGKIDKINAIRGNKVFFTQAKEALHRTAKYLEQKGKRIQPAELEDGTIVNLKFKQSIVLTNPNVIDSTGIQID